MIDEFEDDSRNRKCCASCKTVTQYMCSESKKKPTAFKIGVFTVFIVVMCITMLKSVVDSSPILFVKIGQSEVGAIDFTLREKDPASYVQSGNINYYNINPNRGLFGQDAEESDNSNGNVDEEEEGPECTFWPPEDGYFDNNTNLNITICPDHVQLINE